MTNSRGVRAVGMISVGVVAIVAAVVSYAHMQTVAERAGEGWRSWLEPLSVDGLLVGASLVLYIRRTSRFAWLAVSMGILVSLAANLAAAHPTLISRLVSAWPAVALALSYETLLTLVRRTPHSEQHEPTPVASQPAIIVDQSTSDRVAIDRSTGQAPVPIESGDLLDRARRMVAQARQDKTPLGRTRLARQLDITETSARQLLAQIKKETDNQTTSQSSQPIEEESDTDSSTDEPARDSVLVGGDPYGWMRQ